MASRLKGIVWVLCLLMAQNLSAAKIGLLVMATGKYVQFIPPLVASAEKHFCNGHEITYFIFTDGVVPPVYRELSPMYHCLPSAACNFSSKSDDISPTCDVVKNVVTIYQQRLGWPYDTMNRYHAYAASSELLETQDYLFACDADMLFVGPMGDEILGERVATLHPGFYNKARRDYSYDTNPRCTAYIGPKEGEHYFAGGFYGGSSAEMLKIFATNIANIDKDLENGIIAVWHDESHWNRYCIDNPPTVILDPSYCYPESWHLPGYSKRLLALDKNHSEMRAVE
jgi:histo-blood group ABO system transferase